MGVPKFFRWLSERYPLINQIVESNNFPPEFDNFYLDMNGIIHHCTHPTDQDNVVIKLTEKEMMLTIIQYIDKLFHMIKPQRLIYLAIDGVAPRAKMNQQRQRRFRSARDQKEALETARQKGLDVSSEKPFDSNCITPGTEFMANLSQCLRFFVKKKIQEDALWRKCKVIFSGPEVPGEGEHKIMEFIRQSKAQPDWDPNVRHCLYGLDADLIMLSLTTHEPHFSLLREDVLTKTKKGPSSANDFSSTRFHLLHLGLVREYFDLEFHSEQLSFQFDLERVIDDFVLMCFFVGNDFLPNLPYQDIAEGALNNMFDTYKALLPLMGGYITDGKNIDFKRLEMYISRLAEFEKQQFELIDFDLDKFKGGEEDQPIAPSDLQFASLKKQSLELKKKRFESDLKSLGVSADSKDEEEDDTWKDMYYKDKFGKTIEDKVFIHEIRSSFIHGILWVLNYYHDGCVSWGWFYPYHYAPLASDLVNLSDLKIHFDLGTPFLPFQQLLAVLPRESSNFLPEPYKKLMNEPLSPIIDFYPPDFVLDMNGKKNAWEGIALIPFIDQGRLLDAIKHITPNMLNAAERLRNSYGPAWTFKYEPTKKYYSKSPIPDSFPDVPDSCVLEVEYHLPPYPTGKHEGFKLCKGVKIGLFVPPGFPTLQAIDFEPALRSVHVNVFGSGSRKESMVLQVLSPEEDALPTAISFIGKSVFVGFPYFKEAIVDMISDAFATHYAEKKLPHNVETAQQWRKEVQYIENTQLSTKGIDLGQTRVLLHVRVLDRMQESMDGSKTKLFHVMEEVYPLQLCTKELQVRDGRSEEVVARPLNEIFPPGTQFIYLGQPQYGCRGSVVQLEPNRFLTINLTVDPPTPTFGRFVAQKFRDKYYPLYVASKMLNISPRVLAKITASVFFEPGRLNLGLCMKFSGKSQQVAGYSRLVPKRQNNNNFYERGFRSQNQWEFSDKAINLIREYAQKFPRIFELMEENPEASYYNVEDLFYDREAPANPPPLMGAKKPETPSQLEPEAEENEVDVEEEEKEGELDKNNSKAAQYVKNIKAWLKTLEIRNLPKVPTGSDSLTDEAIKEVEKEADAYFVHAVKAQREKVMKGVDPYLLLKPVDQLPAEFRSEVNYALGDRVIVVSERESVPFGAVGTIVAVKGVVADLVLDQQYMGGTNLEKRCSDLRGASVPMNCLLNISQPYTPQRLLQPATRKKLRSSAEGLTTPINRRNRPPEEDYTYVKPETKQGKEEQESPAQTSSEQQPSQPPASQNIQQRYQNQEQQHPQPQQRYQRDQRDHRNQREHKEQREEREYHPREGQREGHQRDTHHAHPREITHAKSDSLFRPRLYRERGGSSDREDFRHKNQGHSNNQHNVNSNSNANTLDIGAHVMYVPKGGSPNRLPKRDKSPQDHRAQNSDNDAPPSHFDFANFMQQQKPDPLRTSNQDVVKKPVHEQLKKSEEVEFIDSEDSEDERASEESADPTAYWEYLQKKYGSQANIEKKVKFASNVIPPSPQQSVNSNSNPNANASDVPPEIRGLYLQQVNQQQMQNQPQQYEEGNQHHQKQQQHHNNQHMQYRPVHHQQSMESQGESQQQTVQNPDELSWQQKELLSKRNNNNRGKRGGYRNYNDRGGYRHDEGDERRSKPVNIEGGRGRGRGRGWQQRQTMAKSM